MKHQKITWIAFLATLSALTIPSKTLAENDNYSQFNRESNLENRLNRISNSLKAREKELTENSQVNITTENPLLAGGWVKGYRRGFVNNSGGGGFINRRGWGDGGGFLNRRY